MLLHYPLLLLYLAFIPSGQSHAVELEYPNEFQIRQEPSIRTFSILNETQFLGAIVSSDYGQLDFYDQKKIKICTNLMDSLYDNSSNFLGCIEWVEDSEAQKWFWQRKNFSWFFNTHIILYSKTHTPLLTLDQEEKNAFVFREYETKKPLAIAIWSWSILGHSCIAFCDRSVQNWNVIIVDRPLCEEKQISLLLLSWPLLKHSQRHFPSPREFPYE